MKQSINPMFAASALVALTVCAAGCPPTGGGSCEWEHWQGTCELQSVDLSAPNSSGNVLVRGVYTITPSAGSGTPPNSFVHALYTTPEGAAGAKAHLEQHPRVSCASAELTRGSCGPWAPTFDLPDYASGNTPPDAPPDGL